VNKIIPADIWPPGDTLAPWDIKIEPSTPYQEQAKEEKAKMIEELNLTSDVSKDYESD
ncbi:hypothetical protein Goshw_030324, partial [Gossypium schwendimanii]|nr:hypothetical protein [Gossypium schwendimanii]